MAVASRLSRNALRLLVPMAGAPDCSGSRPGTTAWRSSATRWALRCTATTLGPSYASLSSPEEISATILSQLRLSQWPLDMALPLRGEGARGGDGEGAARGKN